MNKILHKINFWLFLIGILSFFANERYFASEKYYKLVFYSSLLIVVISLAIVLFFVINSYLEQNYRQFYGWCVIGIWRLCVFSSILIYIWYSYLIVKTGVVEGWQAKILLGLWLLLLVLGIFAGIGAEFSFRSIGTGEFAELFRIKNATLLWLSIGVLFCFLVCLNYIGYKKDKSFDLTYLKLSSPSESTLNLIASLPEQLSVVVFYPAKNEVLPYIKEYMGLIQQHLPGKINVKYFDVEVHPTEAEKYQQSKNGRIIFQLEQANKKEILYVGLNLTSARSIIKTFDSQIQQVLLKLKDFNKTVYITTGHGELSLLSNVQNPFRTISLLEKLLKTQNIKVQELQSSMLLSKIPDDAACVMIIGPSRGFLDQEIRTLEEYVKQGGSLFVFLDVINITDTGSEIEIINNKNDKLSDFLKQFGIEFKKEVLANENQYVAFKHSPSDKWFIFTNMFGFHESILNLARNEEKIAVLLYQSGHLVISPQQSQWKVYETIKSISGTFADLNKNYIFDSDKEQKRSYVIGAVAVREDSKNNNTKETNQENVKTQQSKIIVVADSQIVSDALIRNPANAIFVLDSVRWMFGLNEIKGAIKSEEDIPIKHTKKENILWFNLTIIGMPVLVLVVGFIFTRRNLFKRRVR